MKGLWIVETLMRQVAIIRCNTHQVQKAYIHIRWLWLVETLMRQVAIIRCNAHQAQRHTD